MSKSSYSIFDFLRNCGGNWRNCIYIPCSFCLHPCRAEQRGALLTADSYGRPRAVSVLRYETVTGQRVDPDECVGTIRQYAFDTLYREFAFWECEDMGECLLCHLDQEVSAGPSKAETKDAPPSFTMDERCRPKRSIFRPQKPNDPES